MLKMQNHSSVTSAYVETAWLITLGCEQQSVPLPALLIGNQCVIEKFEQSRPESRKIEIVTLFGVARRHLLSRVLLHVLGYPFLASCKFFLDFSSAKLLNYDEFSGNGTYIRHI